MRPHHKTPRPALSDALERRVLLTGLTGQYFDRADFTDLKLTRTDATVAFNWGSAAPDGAMGVDGFSVRWTGQVRPEFSENYTFYVKSDDGVRLWVDGRLVIDNWVNQSVTEKSATLPLTAGRDYDVRLDYYDSTSSAQVTLSWSSPSIAKQTIPSARLFPSPSGLAATYFDNQDLTGQIVTRTDTSVDFNWGSGSPASGIAPTTYSATWTGEVIPQYSQTYTFFVTTDAGAAAKLWVDRELVFDSGSVQPMAQVKMEAGKRYDIELTYSHGTGSANVKLEWSSPSQARQTIPGTRLVATKFGAIPTREPTYTNPVTDKDRPDPGVIFDGGYYWMTHTTGGPNNGWPLYRSTDMMTWTSMGNMLTSANRPAFMDDGAFWAPEIHKINGQYVITGTARSTLYSDRTVIAIATAAEITGPYTVRSTPIVGESAVGNLDSTIFQDWDGRVYLIWKRQSNSATAANGSIRLRELDPANLTQFASGSTETVLLNNAGGGAWENNIEEAPEVIHRGSYYYLFYSGSTINTTYAVGVARATSLTGTYTRYPGNVPILQSNSTWGGPGHGAFVQDVDGTWWFYYHARHQDNPSFGRVQMLDKVVWTADGWPTFAGGTPSKMAQTGPRVDAASGTGRYTVSGDAGGVSTADVIVVVRNAADASFLDVQVNGATMLSVPFDAIQSLTINGGGGNDTLLLNYSRGECIPGTGITFDASTGTDSVRIAGASGTDAFHITPGRITHGTGAVSFTAAESIGVQNGTFRLDADLNSMPFAAYDSDTEVIFAASPQHLGAVTLIGASARFSATSGMALSVAALTISSGGTLDLADNAVVVDYTTTSAESAVRSLLYSGRAGGTWAGTGIVSSTAAASPNGGIGYIEAATLGVASWGGFAVDGTAILLKAVSVGDTNMDGRIDADDYARTDRGKAKGLGTWVFGDFDYDGIVTTADLVLLNQSVATASFSEVPATVVEPPPPVPDVSTALPLPVTPETDTTTPDPDPAPTPVVIAADKSPKKSPQPPKHAKAKPKPKPKRPSGPKRPSAVEVQLALAYRAIFSSIPILPKHTAKQPKHPVKNR